MKCLVVSFHYPPDPAIGAVRVGAIAEALESAGHEVRVITSANAAAHGVSSQAVRRAAWFDVRTVSYLRSKVSATGSHPKPPEAQRRTSGGPVEAAEARATPGGLRGAPATWVTPGSPLRTTLAKARAELLECPDAMAGWIPGAVHQASSLTKTWLPEVVVSSGPPFSAHFASARIANRLGAPWVADYRDLWTNGTYYDKSILRRTIDRRLERRLLATAAFATTVSEPLAMDLRKDFAVRAETVPNGFDAVDVEPLDRRSPLSDARLNLLFVGNNLYGGRRTPRLLFEAAAQMGLRRADVRFHFLGTDPEFVLATAQAAGVEELVAAYPRTTQSESVAMQARADVLMLLMWDDPGEAGVFSGKVYEYIAVRRPIVMVGYPHGVAAELVRSRDLGWVVSSRGSAMVAMQSALEVKQCNALLPDLDSSLTLGLGRAEQTARLVAMLEDVVAH